MKYFLKRTAKVFRKPIVLGGVFVILNIALFLNILTFHSKIEFNRFNYKVSAHHFIKDSRIEGGLFDLTNALGQFDAQWHLKIAERGYPVNPKTMSLYDDGTMDGFTYAFFPLYPAIVGILNFFINNVELAAFSVSVIFIVLSFFSFIYVVKKHFDLKISYKAAFLLFFFPFSIFFRSYFAEGVLLFLLVWFTYFFHEKEYLKSSFFLSLITITKGTAFLLLAIFVYQIFVEFRKREIVLSKILLILFMLFIPLALWFLYNYINTGSFTYFLSTRSFSGVSPYTVFPFLSVLHNIALLFLFPILPFHSLHASKVDVLTVLVFLIFLIKSRKTLPRTYWLVAFCLWLSPLLAKDMMSYSRYQSINFPIFIYLAQTLKGKQYLIVFIVFIVSLMITSLFFVNWWWVG